MRIMSKVHIRIVNLRDYALYRDEVLIRVDRSSPVGSPYHLDDKNDPSQRSLVCELYHDYFSKIVDKSITNEQLNSFYAYPINRAAFLGYIQYITSMAKKRRVALGCWCAPRQCHAETIKAYIEEQLEKQGYTISKGGD